MSIVPPSKHLASLSIEDLLQHTPQQRQQNWLLTYVDVFILIIMLVITLMALSDFESEVKQQASNQLAKQQKTPAPIKNIPLSIKPTKEQAFLTSPSPEPVAVPQSLVDNKIVNEQVTVDIQEKTAQIIAEQANEVMTKESPVKSQENKNDLQEKFKQTISELGLVDSVNMKVSLGYAQLEIQDKILFKSSEATLLNAGQALLKKLIALLKQSTGLIYIEGHTDNRPIKTVKFPSNWELGAARATSVLHYLATQKLDVNRLRAVTYGSTKPVADNSTKQGREKNRRVSLVIKISDKED